ncbi:3550_t:CDS:2, partial [Rhizophagus irregularis]
MSHSSIKVDDNIDNIDYFVIYSSEDKSILGWLVNENDNRQSKYSAHYVNQKNVELLKLYKNYLLCYYEKNDEYCLIDLSIDLNNVKYLFRLRNLEHENIFSIKKNSIGFLSNGSSGPIHLVVVSLNEEAKKAKNHKIYLYSFEDKPETANGIWKCFQQYDIENVNEDDFVHCFVYQTKLFLFNGFQLMTQYDLLKMMTCTKCTCENQYFLFDDKLRNYYADKDKRSVNIVINKSQTLIALNICENKKDYIPMEFLEKNNWITDKLKDQTILNKELNKTYHSNIYTLPIFNDIKDMLKNEIKEDNLEGKLLKFVIENNSKDYIIKGSKKSQNDESNENDENDGRKTVLKYSCNDVISYKQLNNQDLALITKSEILIYTIYENEDLGLRYCRCNKGIKDIEECSSLPPPDFSHLFKNIVKYQKYKNVECEKYERYFLSIINNPVEFSRFYLEMLSKIIDEKIDESFIEFAVKSIFDKYISCKSLILDPTCLSIINSTSPYKAYSREVYIKKSSFITNLATTTNYETTKGLRAISNLLLSFKFLIFFRVFQLCGTYFAIIIGVPKKAFPFLIVLFFLLFGFAHAFFILQADDNAIPSIPSSIFDPSDYKPNNIDSPWNKTTVTFIGVFTAYREIELYYLPACLKKKWNPYWIYYDIPVKDIRELIHAIDNKKTYFIYHPIYISKRLRNLLDIPEPKDLNEEVK